MIRIGHVARCSGLRLERAADLEAVGALERDVEDDQIAVGVDGLERLARPRPTQITS